MAKKGLPTLDAAKKFIGEKIINKQEAELSGLGVHPDNYDSYECKDAFARSSYTEADAKAALTSFGFLSSLDDAKEYIGLKIINGPDYEKSVLEPMGITRNNFDRQDCLAAFESSGYSAADVREAKKQFDFLGTSSTQEIKEYIGLKIVNNYETMLADVGITPQPFDKQDLMDAFSRSTYSSADVTAAKEKFSFLAGKSDDEVKGYIGLKIVNGYEQMLSDVGITQNKWDSQDCLAAFNKSGYDAADVKAAKDKFDFLRGSSDTDVKEYIGLKIVNDYESMLKDAGIVPTKAHDHPSRAEHIVSQQEMNQHAFKLLGNSESKLAGAAKELRANLDPDTKKDLDKALKAFDAFKDAQGVFAGNQEARGGSLMALVEAGEEKRLVDQMKSEVSRAGHAGYFNYAGTSKVTDAPQQEMNAAAYAAFQGADTKMKGLVDKLSKQLQSADPESVKELAAAQSAFEGFRDAQATLAGNMEARGGSLFGLIHASALEALTNQRIAVLEKLVG